MEFEDADVEETDSLPQLAGVIRVASDTIFPISTASPQHSAGMRDRECI